MKELRYRYIIKDTREYEKINYGKYSLIELGSGVYCPIKGDDDNQEELFCGDIVEFFGKKYKVIFVCGAICLEILGAGEYIDWDMIENQIYPVTMCNNVPRFTMNDHVISLFEIICNFNQEPDYCDVIQILKGGLHE